MKKKISILGSTGSIGLTSLKIVDKKKSFFKVNLLSANKNFNLICNQIKKYKPNYFVITDLKIFLKVKEKYKKNKIIVLNNFNFRNSISKSDITITAIPGIDGLLPTISITKFSKKILVANKESIICGWSLIQKEAIKNKVKIIPVDSEHFSIMKLIENHKLKEISKIYLTASGGPFLNYTRKKFLKIKPKDALKHPKWKMGKKISIDSSTLMNKILELVEAQKLFDIPAGKLDIIIHPESLVHAIIELKNGLVKFIYHETSMIIPLVNAIFDGNLEINNFFKIKKNYNEKKKIIKDLIFKKVNAQTFPIIKIKNKINQYPSSSIIVNASNEILVDQFLKKKIHFLSISKIIMAILKDRNYLKYAIKKPKNINQISEIDVWARKLTMDKIKK